MSCWFWKILGSGKLPKLNSLASSSSTIFLGNFALVLFSKKISIGVMTKTRFYLSSKTLRLLHYFLVYPYLPYRYVAWSTTNCSNLNCIYLLEKPTVQLTAKVDTLANTAPIVCQVRPLNVFSINYFSIAIFMYSHYLDLLSVTFNAFLPPLWYISVHLQCTCCFAIRLYVFLM